MSSLSALARKYWWALIVVVISCGGIVGIATGVVTAIVVSSGGV